MKILSAILFTTLLSITSFAQDSCKTETLKVKHGVQFQIVDLLRLASYRDYTFSYRFLLNEKSGLRFGVNLNFRKSDDDRNSKNDYDQQKSPSDSKIFSLKLSAQYLLNIMRYKQFNLFIGGGPFYQYYDSESNTSALTSAYSKTSRTNSKRDEYGIDLMFGVEYWLTENVAFSAESGISAYYSQNHSDRISNEIDFNESTRLPLEDYLDRNEFIIDDLSVSLGISVFF